jgi:two-component system CheB/CheR fusion protein
VDPRVAELEAELVAAQALGARRDRLLSVMLHELRSPLSALMLWADVLRAAALDERQRARAVDAIRQSTQAQLRLIEGVHDVVRAMTGRLRLDHHPVALNDAVAAALPAALAVAALRGVRLETHLDPAAGEVAGDRARLELLTTVLLGRALRTTGRDGHATLATRRGDGEVELAVSDSGHGIAPELLPHALESPADPSASLCAIEGGLGLDLATVRVLVDAHGGRARVESDGVGRGTTVLVRLPTLRR